MPKSAEDSGTQHSVLLVLICSLSHTAYRHNISGSFLISFILISFKCQRKELLGAL